MQRNILKLQKKHCSCQHTARNDCPECFFLALLFSFCPLSLHPFFTCMAACQMWREAYLDLMILQMLFFMLNNNSILIGTGLPGPYLDTNRVVCHRALSHQFSWWWGSFAIPNHLSRWQPSEADQIALVNTSRQQPSQHELSGKIEWVPLQLALLAMSAVSLYIKQSLE